MTHLGRLTRVDLRDTWKCEAQDFTPWLAQEENLSLLAETLGLDLELNAVEQNIGSFRADILCKDTLSDRWVLIENQLEQTDHKHLGQLMTYAAGLDAVTIVWIAARIRDEHRAALDWLNEITASDVQFFALEVELWKIAESPAAPKFNVVSKPNDWSRNTEQNANASTDVTPLKQQYFEFWSQFIEMAQNRMSNLHFSKPKPRQYINLGVGGGLHCYGAIKASDNSIACGVTFQGSYAKSMFYKAMAMKDTIENELGFALDWMEKPNSERSGVAIRKLNTDPTNEQDWNAQQDWLLIHLGKLFAVFRNHLHELKTGQDDEIESNLD